MINMVYEDYGLDRGHVNLELSYMLSRKSLMKLTHDTPPVKIGNFRQFQGFIRLRKSDQVRLCVEVSLRSNKKTMKTQTLMENQSDYNHDEDTDTDGERFDYCDDSDGATSDDEDFRGYGLTPKLDIEMKKEYKPKIGSATKSKKAKVVTHVRQQLDSIDIVVGQSFDSKSSLTTRLKILTIVQKFDYDVEYSMLTLLIVKCWIGGCSWKLRASPTSATPRFTVRSYVSEHTCSVTERSARCRQEKPEILGSLYTDFIGGVEPTILPSHVHVLWNKGFFLLLVYSKTLYISNCFYYCK